MQSFVRRFHSQRIYLKNLSKFVDKSKKTPELRGAPTIYNDKSSASNYKGYLRAKVPPGLYLNLSQSSPTGSINSETIPASFLPKNDPRRPLTQELAGRDVLANCNAPPVLPGHSTITGSKEYHLTPEHVQEIQKLRSENPQKNSRKALAKHFNVSPLFISLVSEAPKSWKDQMDLRLAEIKSNWHSRRALAREDRKKRKDFWYRA
ncbi:MRPL20 (YKR085C) [Zygosaccharomyces parabailii]|nr:MRPL20 (YKR085C) [Zygosaccharomyces parabailii]CDH09225.1 related to 54S ribosomal protein L20,mitochondrial [Zygosaccharomyces bailii ISA1307]